MRKIDGNTLEVINNSKKRILVYGAGIVARATIITLREIMTNPERIRNCVVTSANHNPSTVEAIKVIELEKALAYFNDIVIVSVKEMYTNDVCAKLEKYGFDDIWVISQDVCIEVLKKKWINKNFDRAKAFIDAGFDKSLTKEEYITFLSRQLKEQCLNFEVNLVDHCNLNCQSCNHFSPIAKQTFLDKSLFKNDMERMSLLFGNRVGTIMLLGGEPLLHPNVIEIMSIARHSFEEAEISIVSNGILLSRMENEFWTACKELNIGILLTKYPLNLDYSMMVQEAQNRNVKLTFTLDSTECKTTYKLPIRIAGGLNAYSNYAKCYHANKCVVLKNGRLYTCPYGAYVNYFNSYYSMKIPEENENSIDIYQAATFVEIENFLKIPIRMCEYCDVENYEYDIPWKTSTRAISEWI